MSEAKEKMKDKDKKYYRIREVVAMLNIPASTLRFWEDTFEQLEPDKTSSGHRRYTSENIEVCELIKHLLRDKGYSLEYAKRELDAYRKCPPRNDFVCKTPDDALNLLHDVTKMVGGNLHAEARIKAVERWIRSIGIVEEEPRPPHKNTRGKEYFAQED